MFARCEFWIYEAPVRILMRRFERGECEDDRLGAQPDNEEEAREIPVLDLEQSAYDHDRCTDPVQFRHEVLPLLAAWFHRWSLLFGLSWNERA